MSSSRPLWARASRYVRKDLKDIVFPPPLPDPVGTPARRRLTWVEFGETFREACRQYSAAWKEYRTGTGQAGGGEPPSSPLVSEIAQEFAAVAKGGAKGAAPYLQRLATIRATVVKDSIAGFTSGYRDGLAEFRNGLPSAAGADPVQRPGGDDASTADRTSPRPPPPAGGDGRGSDEAMGSGTSTGAGPKSSSSTDSAEYQKTSSQKSSSSSASAAAAEGSGDGPTMKH